MDEQDEKAIAAGNSDRPTNSSTNLNSGSPITNQQQRLLQESSKCPADWALVAVGDTKNPLGENWQTSPLDKQDFEDAVQVGRFECLPSTSKEGNLYYPPIRWWFAIGVLCGTLSHGLLFLDHDGASCDNLIEKLSGQSIAVALPKTPTVTSGKLGRYQSIYFVPERFWGAISTKKIPTHVKGEDGSKEQLELRWDGCQSVVAGYHPDTGAYYWLPGQSPEECEIAEVPLWVVEQMLQRSPTGQLAQADFRQSGFLQQWTTVDWARSYLFIIPATEDYDLWIKVGMALRFASESLLSDWDDWSQGASNYDPGVCEEHWQSFNADGGITVGTLGMLAKQHGWESPFGSKGHNHPVLTGAGDNQTSASSESSNEDSEEFGREVQSLVELTEETAPIQGLLHHRLMDALVQRAKQFNVPVETFLTVLLSIAASLLKIGTFLEIDASSDFRCAPILWAGLVGESGATKSPIFSSLLKPLEGLQAKADKAYEVDFAQYHESLATWQKKPKSSREVEPKLPAPREYYLQDLTLEAMYDCLSKQPGIGLLLAVDELASLFNGFNQYRAGGKGNDRQRVLSLYDGRALKVNRRSSNRISLSHTSVSLIGTIQPCVLHKFMRDLSEVDGYWARFFWVILPLTEMPAPGGTGGHNLSLLLQGLYQGLISLIPVTYQFDENGHTVWSQWHCWCEKQKVDEPSGALRAVYPKSKERAARIALVLHCVNAVIEGKVPDGIIPSELLESAIAFTKWAINQSKLIYASAGIVTFEESARVARFVAHFKGKGWVKGRQVTHWHPKKPKAAEARAFMQQVVGLGYAINNGKAGEHYQIKIKDESSNFGNNQPQPPEMASVELGNKTGNNLVTTDRFFSEQFLGEEIENGSKNNLPSETEGASVTNVAVSSGSVSNSLLGKFQVGVLPEVTSLVTALEPFLDKNSASVCYQVTEYNFQVGDRVWYTGEKYAHLWRDLELTIDQIQEYQASCRKPDGYFTTWIDLEDLEAAL